MRVLAQTGQRSAAVQQYNACAALLAKDLQVDPSPETQKLLTEIKRAAAAVPTATSAPGGASGGLAPQSDPKARGAWRHDRRAALQHRRRRPQSGGLRRDDRGGPYGGADEVPLAGRPGRARVGTERLTAEEMRRLGEATA